MGKYLQVCLEEFQQKSPKKYQEKFLDKVKVFFFVEISLKESLEKSLEWFLEEAVWDYKEKTIVGIPGAWKAPGEILGEIAGGFPVKIILEELLVESSEKLFAKTLEEYL